MTRNIKTTYFLQGTRVIGSLDTAEIPSLCGEAKYFETMDFMGTSSEDHCNEKSRDMATAIVIHDAWKAIIANRFNAKAIDVTLMGVDMGIPSPIKYIIDEYEKVMSK